MFKQKKKKPDVAAKFPDFLRLGKLEHRKPIDMRRFNEFLPDASGLFIAGIDSDGHVVTKIYGNWSVGAFIAFFRAELQEIFGVSILGMALSETVSKCVHCSDRSKCEAMAKGELCPLRVKMEDLGKPKEDYVV